MVDGSIDMEMQAEIQNISLSNEWGGLISASVDDMVAFPWLIYPPVIALTLTILAMIFLVEGMKSVFLEQKP